MSFVTEIKRRKIVHMAAVYGGEWAELARESDEPRSSLRDERIPAPRSRTGAGSITEWPPGGIDWLILVHVRYVELILPKAFPNGGIDVFKPFLEIEIRQFHAFLRPVTVVYDARRIGAGRGFRIDSDYVTGITDLRAAQTVSDYGLRRPFIDSSLVARTTSRLRHADMKRISD